MVKPKHDQQCLAPHLNQRTFIGHNEMYQDCIFNLNTILILSIFNFALRKTMRSFHHSDVHINIQTLDNLCDTLFTSSTSCSSVNEVLYSNWSQFFRNHTGLTENFFKNGLIFKEVTIRHFLKLSTYISAVEENNRNCLTWFILSFWADRSFLTGKLVAANVKSKEY